MPRFTTDNISILSNKIKATDEQINQAASQAINRTLTFSRRLSVREITSEVNLQSSYVSRNMRIAQRASPNKLIGIVRTNTKVTLLTRYPHRKTAKGISIAVNRAEGYRTIRSAFRVTNLRRSGASGIAVKNRNAAEIFKRGIHPATPPKRRKLQRVLRNARLNPKGITVLHGRSINDLFLSVRNDIRPRYIRFLNLDFQRQLRNQLR